MTPWLKYLPCKPNKPEKAHSGITYITPSHTDEHTPKIMVKN